MARDAKVWLVGGSFPEATSTDHSSKLYNTCLVHSPDGDLVATHRKVHLFDIDIPGKITFKESSILSPGSSITQFNTPWGDISVGICYDLRFPELAMIASRNAAKIMIYPGAFNLTTGPLHWSLLLRSRALDNQFFTIGCAPARSSGDDGGYKSWGNSLVCDPMGKVLAQVESEEQGEETLVVDLDLDSIVEARKGIPVTEQRRFDVYTEVKEVL
ncbi:MAG: hypothetical protein SGCHY_004907 [Lobulomycetales sp.]